MMRGLLLFMLFGNTLNVIRACDLEKILIPYTIGIKQNTSIGKGFKIQLYCDAFFNASREDPVYFRITMEHGALAETRVPVGGSPILLAITLWRKGFYENIDFHPPKDALTIVRWVRGEHSIWLKADQSTLTWASHNGNPLAPYYYYDDTRISIGISRQRSLFDSESAYYEQKSNLIANSTLDGEPVSTYITLQDLEMTPENRYSPTSDFYYVEFFRQVCTHVTGVEEAAAEEDIIVHGECTYAGDEMWPRRMTSGFAPSVTYVLFPWVNINNQFETMLHMSNPGSKTATVALMGTRISGQQIYNVLDIPPHGNIEISTAEILEHYDSFSTELPFLPGSGFSLLVSTSNPAIYGSFRTKHTQTAQEVNPATGNAINIFEDDMRVGASLDLGYWKGKSRSAVVLVNAGEEVVNIDLYGYNSEGELIQRWHHAVIDLEPYHPMTLTAEELFGEGPIPSTLIAHVIKGKICALHYDFDADLNPSCTHCQTVEFTPPTVSIKQ